MVIWLSLNNVIHNVILDSFFLGLTPDKEIEDYFSTTDLNEVSLNHYNVSLSLFLGLCVRAERDNIVLIICGIMNSQSTMARPHTLSTYSETLI